MTWYVPWAAGRRLVILTKAFSQEPSQGLLLRRRDSQQELAGCPLRGDAARAQRGARTYRPIVDAATVSLIVLLE